MLRGIHKASSTWLGKGLMAGVMGLITISFVVWGIGDIFRGFGLNSAVTIGDTKISLEQFREYYNDKLRLLSRRAGRPLSPEQARALGLDRQLIGQLVAETTLDQQANVLRLGVSNAEISERIVNDPNFKGVSGQFDRMRFEQVIRDAGFTEGRFVEEQRRTILRRQIALSVAGDVPVPAVAAAALNQYQNEQRSIDYLALGAAQAGDVAAPPADALEKYFDEHKVQFRAPEYRKVTVLSLSPADIARPDDVSDADAKTYYEQRKAQYGTPEKRELRQIVYPNAEEAKAAREKMAEGASFDDLAKERGLKASDTEVGTVTKTAIIDPAVAEAAFALEAHASERTGHRPIRHGAAHSRQDRAGFAEELRGRRRPNQTRDRRGPCQDASRRSARQGRRRARRRRNFGRGGQEVRRQDARHRCGRPRGQWPRRQARCRFAETPNVAAAAFNSDVGVDSDAMQLSNGGYLYYDVTGITPSRERTLAEVKDQVEQRWRDDEVAKRLTAKANELLGRLKTGAPLADVAKSAGVKVETAAPCNAASRPIKCRRTWSPRRSKRRRTATPAPKATRRPNATCSASPT